MGRPIDEDPLAWATAPPANESLEEKHARELAEWEARKINEEIDNRLRLEKASMKKKKKPIKVLLLGQCESGKSTTLKNFQRTYARREWAAERDSWRSIIQLNLLRNVNEILDIVAQELPGSTLSPSHTPDIDPEITYVDASSSSNSGPAPILTEKHQLLKLKLAPLLRVQKDLERKLGPASNEIFFSNGASAAPFGAMEKVSQEFSVNSSNGWKTVLDRFRPRLNSGARSDNAPPARKGRGTELDEATEVIARCKDDIKALWEDSVIRQVLSRRKRRIEDTPGFFLDEVDRIADSAYQPNDDDIIRARLRTRGVQEYRFVVDNGKEVGREWLMYDVGGTRTSRAAWYPYFDDADAIIFLAPISCFDENLVEDRRVNRLEDSYLLWKSLCSCKLLANSQIILFLNKCDLLNAKLMRGVKIKDRVPSYGDRKNDISTATKYFQQHFKEIAKQYSPVARTISIFLTSVIDPSSTAITLAAVEESILRKHLQGSDLM